ncbi:hypothetical protein CDV36_000658 [Fusarium kuroshium]|uniref:Zn(2)-C6 fungal-type domain-containing protein n=1 Tax=Fusarium kuroshium TaxID=2010991 RepID=A0A3M2SQV2_9HYPO|nr:hypothetical protein CDV36_000658 [Fusarium kuroshium]
MDSSMNTSQRRRVPRRTPQACGTCRRRKTKCDGVRPRCRFCASAGVPCLWPSSPQPESIPSPQEQQVDTPVSLPSSGTASCTDVGDTTLSRKAVRRCFELFFTRHFAADFCSFDYRPDLEANYHRKPFLVHAIICLCARYLTPEEAAEGFQLSSGEEVWKRYSQMARTKAKAASDEPSVAHIQGYLVLAVAELLAGSGSRHWMYAGTAIRMAQIMRLNKDYHQRYGPREQEIRRRTYWACLLLDRALASLLCKPHCLSEVNIGIALPSTDTSLAYQEGSRGLTLEGIQSFAGYPSEIGLAPYFIRTVYLWSKLADFNVCCRRNLDKHPPTDTQSLFFQLTSTLQDWLSSMGPSLQWSIQNYHNHCDLGQGLCFVSMHMLLRSSLCVAHQAYLPQLDGFTVLCERMDAAGWSYFHRENCLIETCVSNAMAIGEMLIAILESDRPGQSALQSIWVAASILSAVNTFLWVIYAGDETFSAEETVNLAKSYLETIRHIFVSWQHDWKVAKRWLSSLNAMQAMYRAAYLGDLAQEPTADSSEEELSPDFRPEPGDGFPSVVDLPDLYASLRLVACDSSAMPMDVGTVWLQLSTGWPCDPGGIFDLFPA